MENENAREETGETKRKIVKYMNGRPFGVSDKVKNTENRKTKRVHLQWCKKRKMLIKEDKNVNLI